MYIICSINFNALLTTVFSIDYMRVKIQCTHVYEKRNVQSFDIRKRSHLKMQSYFWSK